MTVGTKSVLFGVHCFFIHPWFVAWAWWRLYGFPWDPRLWVAFFVHDLGYIGKPNMDGPEGESHVELGARVMHALFDYPLIEAYELEAPCEYQKVWDYMARRKPGLYKVKMDGLNVEVYSDTFKWGNFCKYHSRFYAKRDGHPISRLCVADKLALVLTPAWLYLPCARLSGELYEYIGESAKSKGKYLHMHVHDDDAKVWLANVKTYLAGWVEEVRHGGADTRTEVNT